MSILLIFVGDFIEIEILSSTLAHISQNMSHFRIQEL